MPVTLCSSAAYQHLVLLRISLAAFFLSSPASPDKYKFPLSHKPSSRYMDLARQPSDFTKI